ncbi:hypothetical protein FACS189443_6630 [Planctomycetales bacterium]|nr:hypothetical protein FACS189443_6630 [Planctomycetales bacterium]
MEPDIRHAWDEMSRGLILYARQWVGTAAEDVVQEAFLKLLTESPPPDSPKSWLYRVVRNHAIDLKRRQRWFRTPPLRVAGGKTGGRAAVRWRRIDQSTRIAAVQNSRGYRRENLGRLELS